MKKILMLILLLWGGVANAQYDDFYKEIIKASPIFQPLKGVFKVNKVKALNMNGVDKKQAYSYIYSDRSLRLEYCYPESKLDDGCSYFIINGQRVNLKGRFESNFACDLDITSFSLYKGYYKGREYVLLTCINTGSGSSTSTVICNLFDMSNKKAIKYYPLWSKYGSSSCFGDFNKDGILDFLKVRIDGASDKLKLTLTSLKGKAFIPSDDKKYMILKYDGEKLKVEHRVWANK
jgi:hypothetical protein